MRLFAPTRRSARLARHRVTTTESFLRKTILPRRIQLQMQIKVQRVHTLVYRIFPRSRVSRVDDNADANYKRLDCPAC